MNGHSSGEVSRRVALVGMAAGAAWITLVPSGAMGLEPHAGNALQDLWLGERYTDLAGIHAEYLQAVAVFPFSLPPGHTFPVTSRLKNERSDQIWEKGCGTTEALLFWQRATVAYMVDAAGGGRVSDIAGALNRVEQAYAIPELKALFDGGLGLLSSAVAAARRGDLTALRAITTV